MPLALFAGLSLPIGDDAFSSDEVDPTLGAFWSYSAGLDWFGAVVISESANDASLSNAIGISLGLGDDTGAYIEYFGNYGSKSGPQHSLNGGFTYVPRFDLQWDVHAGVGLNRAPDLFIGLGVAYRF